MPPAFANCRARIGRIGQRVIDRIDSACNGIRSGGVEHDPVHAVVAAIEEIAVPLTEPVLGHLGRFPSAAPPGATDSEQRLGIGLEILAG
jgi:hypothetical protein